MKKILLFSVLLTAILLSACGKDTPAPSNVPVIVTESQIDGKPASDYIVKEDERITITSLEVWDEFNYDGNFSDNCLLFLRGFIEGYSDFIEFATVKIENWEIIRDVKVYGYSMAFNFNIVASEIEGLPVGSYKTIVHDTVDCYMEFVESPRADITETAPQTAAQIAVFDWLNYAQYYDYENYGEWDNIKYTHYVFCHYRNKSEPMKFEDFKALVKDKFGVEVTKEQFKQNLYIDDMTLYISSEGRDENQSFDIVDEYTEDNVSTVVVQHYADCNKFIESYKMAYHIDSEERFLHCEILETSPYKPYGLHAIDN